MAGISRLPARTADRPPWRRTRRRLAGGVLATALAAGLATGVMATSGGNARAAVGCTGTGCEGRDPAATGCDADAAARGHRFGPVADPATAGTVAVVESPGCHAAWALLTTTRTAADGTPTLQLWSVGPAGGPETLLHSAPVTCGQCGVSTAMTDWAGSVKACVQVTGLPEADPAPLGGSTADGECSAFF